LYSSAEKSVEVVLVTVLFLMLMFSLVIDTTFSAEHTTSILKILWAPSLSVPLSAAINKLVNPHAFPKGRDNPRECATGLWWLEVRQKGAPRFAEGGSAYGPLNDGAYRQVTKSSNKDYQHKHQHHKRCVSEPLIVSTYVVVNTHYSIPMSQGTYHKTVH
jgi:hypothetical protein